MSQFLKMVSSNNLINTTNIKKPTQNIQNQKINPTVLFRKVALKEIENFSFSETLVIANTLF